MSVDYTAKIMYGWLIEDEAAYDYKQKCYNEGYDTSDYFHCIDAYSGGPDYIYGISVYSTGYLQFIEPEMIDTEAWDDNEDWIECWHEFKQDFPDMCANVKPGFFLIQEVW